MGISDGVSGVDFNQISDKLELGSSVSVFLSIKRHCFAQDVEEAILLNNETMDLGSELLQVGRVVLVFEGDGRFLISWTSL